MQEPSTIYAISMHWFRQWQLFARGLTTDEPGPVNNKTIVAPGSDTQPIRNVRQGSDYAQIDVNLWRFFHGIYGGGPEILLRGNPPPERETSRYSREEEREDEEEAEEEERMDVVTNGDQEMESDTESDAMKQGEEEQNQELDQEEEEGDDQETVVCDQPTVFGLTSKLKETMSLEQEERDRLGGQGDCKKDAVEEQEPKVNGISESPAPSSGRKVRPLVVEPKDKHRMMKSSGIFGPEGEYR